MSILSVLYPFTNMSTLRFLFKNLQEVRFLSTKTQSRIRHAKGSALTPPFCYIYYYTAVPKSLELKIVDPISASPNLFCDQTCDLE